MGMRCGWCALAVLGLVAAGARADVDMASVFPQLRGLPAPDWVKPAVRLAYYSSAATVPGSYEHFTPDKDGNWIDQRTGQRFSKQATGEGQGGHGITTVDVSAVNSKQVVLDVRSWLLTPPGLRPSVLIPGPRSCSVTAASAGSDWYIHPSVLAGLRETTRGDVKVVRMDYPLDDKQHRAVGLEYRTAKSRASSIYDLDSGLLLSHTASVASTGDRTMLTYGRLLGQRQMALPWRTNEAPAWVATITGVDASGAQSVSMPGTFPVQFPLRVTNTITARGGNWLRLRQTLVTGSLVPGIPPTTTESDLVSGPGQVGGLWLPPGALARLTTGQELDVDTLCGTRTVVAQAGATEVVIGESGAVHSAQWTYRVADGMITRIVQTDQSLASTTIDLGFGERR